MIVFENVSKIFSTGTEALKDINLTFEKGEFAFLVGPSGAGKTTLLSLLIREYLPTQGEVWYKDQNVVRLPKRLIPQLRREIGMIFQDFKLLPRKTVFENVAFALEAAGRSTSEINEVVPYMLELVGLVDQGAHFPHQLSSGEAQRVSIARAMVQEPEVLLADEPTGNLDPATGWEVVKFLGQINEWGTTVIMASHDQEIVNALRRRVVRIENGRIVDDQKRGGYEKVKNEK